MNIKSHNLLAYADDIDIVGRNERDITAAFSKIEIESAKMGLIVNNGKAKIMLAIASKTPKQKKVTSGNYNIEVVEDFVYLVSTMNQKNKFSFEIKSRIVLANICYSGLLNSLTTELSFERQKLTFITHSRYPCFYVALKHGCFERR